MIGENEIRLKDTAKNGYFTSDSGKFFARVQVFLQFSGIYEGAGR